MDEAVQRYIDAIPPEQRRLFDHLQSLILELHPEAEVVISYQVPTYKTRSGRVSLGLWKNEVSLYTTEAEHIQRFRSDHPNIKTGKASINLKLSDDVPDGDLRNLLEQAIGPPAPS
jgi:uncharacterized protein YdhG (YjbR/CyaY superfamily)